VALLATETTQAGIRALEAVPPPGRGHVSWSLPPPVVRAGAEGAESDDEAITTRRKSWGRRLAATAVDVEVERATACEEASGLREGLATMECCPCWDSFARVFITPALRSLMANCRGRPESTPRRAPPSYPRRA